MKLCEKLSGVPRFAGAMVAILLISTGAAGQTTDVDKYFPIATGMAWDYRVQFPQNARLPYQPIIEVPSGLICASGLCGLGDWSAGQVDFSMSVAEKITTATVAPSWQATLNANAQRFFFNQSPSQVRGFEVRTRMVSGNPQLEVVEILTIGDPNWRLVRPLARLTSADLAAKQTVSVAAGEFRDVVSVTMVLNGISPYVSGTYSTDVFLAPDVGIIKAVGRNPSGATLYTLELTKLTTPGPPPLPAVTGVSAASFTGPLVAPDSIVSAFGQGMARAAEAANAIPLPTTLGGATLKVTDSAGVERSAQLFFASPGQINFLVPPQTARGTARVTAAIDQQVVAAGTLQIDSVAPGLFTANSTGRGVPAALALRVTAGGAQSFQPVFQCGAAAGSCTATPISVGDPTDQVFLLLFGTGIRGRTSLAGVSATIGGESAEVLAAGAQGDFVGLDQVNVRLPRTLNGRGDVNVVLTVDGKAANVVTVSIAGS